MAKILKLPYLPIIIIFCFMILFRAYIIRFTYPLPVNPEHLLIPALVGFEIRFIWWLTFLIGLGNLILIWLIGQKVFNRKVAYFSAMFYALSPWTAYLDVSGSIYIFLLFNLLLSCLGTIIVKEGKYKLGLVLTITSIVVLIYSSMLFWLLIPILIWGAYGLKLLSPRNLKAISYCSVAFYLLALILIITNKNGFANELHQQISIFNDVGLLNTVNQFRGEINDVNLTPVGKLVENRYTYFTQHIFFNILKHLAPATYFTSQEKLLNFSFSPPILLGFLIPFIFGLKAWVGFFKQFGIASLVVMILTLPSILSQYSPDLIRLVLFAPILFFIISLGFVNYLLPARDNFIRFLTICAVLLIITQFLLTLIDISSHEWPRIDEYFWKR